MSFYAAPHGSEAAVSKPWAADAASANGMGSTSPPRTWVGKPHVSGTSASSQGASGVPFTVPCGMQVVDPMSQGGPGAGGAGLHMKLDYVNKEVEAFTVRLDQGAESSAEWRHSMEVQIKKLDGTLWSCYTSVSGE